MNNDNVIDQYVEKIESEILTIILNNPQKMQEVVLTLEPIDFLNPNCRSIYGALIKLNNSSSIQINKNVLLDYISNNDEYQFDNWQEYIETLINNFYYEDELSSNIEIIYNMSTKRLLDEFANKIIETKIDLTQCADQIAELQKNFLDIIERKKNSHLEPINQVINKCLNSLELTFKNKTKITGTEIGFSAIDEITSGFQNGDLIILAARPGIGKTAISLNFIYNAAKLIMKQDKENKKKIVLFSLEMGKNQICQRLISLASHIDSSKLRNGNLTNNEWEFVKNACNEIGTLPILIDDTANLSIIDIQSKLKQLSNQYEIKLVVIDYLQLIRGQKIKGNVQINRQQEVAFISKTLKAIARIIKTPIIALAQMSRDIEKRSSSEPLLADLRESGAIEQDADIVSFLYHPKNNDNNLNEDLSQQVKNALKDKVNIQFIIAKHRNGATTKINLCLLKKFGLFTQVVAEENSDNV